MAVHDELDTPLAKACRFLGGQSAMARLIGKHQSTVNERLAKGLPVWPDHVLAIEAATGIPRSELRPDLYPIEDYPPSADPASPQSPPKVSP